MTNEHWRFNSNISWHYFCSAQYESVKAKDANNPFIKYHHLRSCIYFSIGCLEAFLNGLMREKLETEKIENDAIQKILRRDSLWEKIEEWPSELSGKPVKLPENIVSTISKFRNVRNEITHAKRRDHSIYAELDTVNPDEIMDTLARTIVIVLSEMKRPFPYWVLGWNYVGMNGNPAHPFENNNLNGFVHSLRNMNISFNNYGSDLTWESRAMTSEHGYMELKDVLSKVTFDIEPFHPTFPSKPRLTRRWWDVEFIKASVPK
jgi:hypothetical protein